MGFSKPKTPKIKPPPPVPQVDEAIKMRNEQDRLYRRRAQGTTVLTADQGLPNLGAVSSLTAGGM